MIVLTEQEVVELTEKERPTAQARELDHLGIFYRVRRDGSICVMRIHAETPDGQPRPARLPAEPQLQP